MGVSVSYTVAGTRQPYFLVEFDIVQDFEGQREIAQENMHSQQANKTEVSQHAIQWTCAVLSHNLTNTASVRQL